MVTRADVTVDRDALRIRLVEPQLGIAAGQAVVLYSSDGDTVLGSATIAQTQRSNLALT